MQGMAYLGLTPGVVYPDVTPGEVIMSDRGGKFTIEEDTRTCTCGKCLDGWLSPVRAFQIFEATSTAANEGRRLLNTPARKKRAVFLGNAQLRLFPLKEHIPEYMRTTTGVPRNFLLGMYGMLKLISHIIDQGLCPTRPTIFNAIRTLKGEHTQVSPITDPACNPAEIEAFLATTDGWLTRVHGYGMHLLASGLDDGLEYFLFALTLLGENREEKEMDNFDRWTAKMAHLPKCKNGNERWLGVLERLSHV